MYRLYNIASKIHANLPPWTHHRTALSHCNAMTFQNSTSIQIFRLIIRFTTTHTALFPGCIMSQECVIRSLSQVLIPVPVYRHRDHFLADEICSCGLSPLLFQCLYSLLLLYVSVDCVCLVMCAFLFSVLQSRNLL